MIPYRNGFNNLERLADQQMPHPAAKLPLLQVGRQSDFESHLARLVSRYLREAVMISKRIGSVESEDVFRLCQTFDKRR
jgi:hypothetical protein